MSTKYFKLFQERFSILQIIFLSIFLFLAQCMEAKKSSFDIKNSAIGRNIIFSGFLLAGSSASTPQYSATNLRFLATGTASTQNPTNANEFSNWTINPSLPTGLSIDNSTGAITCTCLTSEPFHKASYTISATRTTTNQIASVTITIERMGQFQLIDGNDSYGIGNTSVSKFYSFPISYNGKLYVFFQESGGGIKGMVWSGTGDSSADWTYVNNGVNLFSNTNFSYPKAVVWNNNLYVLSTDGSILGLKKFDGTTWSDVLRSGSNNLDSTGNYSQQNVDLSIVNNKLMIAFYRPGNTTIQVIIWDGESTWTQFGDSFGTILRTHAISFNNRFYIAYAGSTANSLYLMPVKNDELGFDSALGPINFNPSLTGNAPHMVTMGGQLYIAWQELYTTTQVRLKSFDGNSTFTFLDGNIPNSSINYQNTVSGYEPNLIEWNSEIHIAFQENTSPYGLRVKKKTASNEWIALGSNLSYSFNYTPGVQANNPRFAVHGDQLFLTWHEISNSYSRIRVRGMFQ